MAKAKDFEEMLEDLENIVSSLEKDNLKLDESISKFEEGMKLTKLCNTKLEEAEKKITILLNENGEIKEENFLAE
ncbi:MAG: exodeoxyribonuclease VII small subunit [Clostridia bacterium]|jgi:exodeoxyribonuclease VII small subunit|nr:exodeoxyribonuclease VII small subunit [Clostridia bacterium]